jgi:hypothetical protein
MDQKLFFSKIASKIDIQFINTCPIVIVANMSHHQTKKRKVGDENRSFNEKWKLDYFFTLVKDKAVCLLCSDSVSVLKEYNIKRHYEAKHETNYKNIQDQMRKDQLNKLEKSLKQQQNIFKVQTFSSDLAVKASYTVSKILTKKMKPFADGEMIKECLTAVAEIAFPDKKDIISKISLSRFTIGRRIEDMSENITAILGERIQKFEWCSLALDESCDISDKSQLAIFVRAIDSNFNITEELGSLIPMKGTTTGKDLYNELKSMLENLSIPLDKIVGISTDGAPAMASMNVGVAGTLFNDIKNLTLREIFVNHCIIHQQNLCAKILNMPNVTTPVIKLINFLKSRALNHRQFNEFLKDLGSEYGDVIYNTEVRWLSRGAMLKRVYNLKNDIQLFVEMKEYQFPHFEDKEWMCDFAFLVDITQHLYDLNMELQGRDQFIHNMFDKINAFESKLKIWNKHLLSNNMSHFAHLKKENPSETRKYAQHLQKLITEFESRF